MYSVSLYLRIFSIIFRFREVAWCIYSDKFANIVLLDLKINFFSYECIKISIDLREFSIENKKI